MVTITTTQKNNILDLQAKLKLLENQLQGLKDTINSEVEAENVKYRNKLATIEGNYASQISAKETDIQNIKSQLEEII